MELGYEADPESLKVLGPIGKDKQWIGGEKRASESPIHKRKRGEKE